MSWRLWSISHDLETGVLAMSWRLWSISHDLETMDYLHELETVEY